MPAEPNAMPPGPPTADPAADAEKRGVTVRLDAGKAEIEAPVVAHLAVVGGSTTDLPLADDGQPPDVAADDGVWSGAVWQAGDRYAVSISAGAEKWDAGEVAWPHDEQARDLTLTLKDGAVSAQAAAAPDMSAAPEGTPNPVPAGEGAPGGPTTPAGAPSPTGQPVTVTDTGGDDSTLLFFGGGLVLLLAIGLYFLWDRRAARQSAGGLRARPTAELWGAGSPDLADGVSFLAVDARHEQQLLADILGSLAWHHRVLVSAPEDFALPRVAGGPVYRTSAMDLVTVGDAAAALQERSDTPVVVVLIGQEAAALAEHPDLLPRGLGVLAVVREGAGELPAISFARDGEGWLVGERRLRMRRGRLCSP